MERSSNHNCLVNSQWTFCPRAWREEAEGVGADDSGSYTSSISAAEGCVAPPPSPSLSLSTWSEARLAKIAQKRGTSTLDQMNLVQFIESYDLLVASGTASYLAGLGMLVIIMIIATSWIVKKNRGLKITNGSVPLTRKGWYYQAEVMEHVNEEGESLVTKPSKVSFINERKIVKKISLARFFLLLVFFRTITVDSYQIIDFLQTNGIILDLGQRVWKFC
ncbi:hypothetical protein MSG28_009102 [Choristoneura fumiferana]|uniref:Uncharacterized protein n=1 Tax=Choristoneura fumiferana TaxID=7141 RepID=A0ACC0KWP2_CHOFU|nr:hypothetical protein MSG28_009102 [Choristoneura fumiferana]